MTPQAPPEDAGFFDRPFHYPWAPPDGSLDANQLLLDQVSINVDADFFVAAWFIARATAGFEILLTDADGYQLFNEPVSSLSMSNNAPVPQVFSPAHRLPAGGKMKIQIRDVSGSANEIQIVFVGWKRYRRPAAQQ